VAVLPDADAPSSKPRQATGKKRRASAKSAKKSASSRARRRGR
jgi:hypothetical protein